MSKTSRVAILSFAHYHANFWAEAFKASSTTDLVAIWDEDHARGREAAHRFDVRFEPDLKQTLQICDAVAICSTTIQHPELVELAAGRSSAVMCSETVWWRCHRRLLADHLVLVEGLVVEHLFPDGRLAPHPVTPGGRLAGGQVVYDLPT